VYYNPAFKRLWQRNPEGISATPAYILDTIHPDDPIYLQSIYKETLAGQEKQDVEFRILLPNQDEKWGRTSGLCSGAGCFYVKDS
jgi:hypothetical protein